MNDAKRTREALGQIHDELVELVGPESWPDLEAQITELIRSLDQGAVDPDLFPVFILRLLRPFREAHRRFAQELSVAGDAHRSGRGWPMPSTLHDHQHPMVTRYLDIACPRVVSLDAPRILVVVRLRVSPAAASAVDASVEAREGLAVEVRIDAPDFEVLGAVSQSTLVLRDQDSAALVFDLRPRRVDACHINLDLYQAGSPLGSASISVRVVDGPAPAETATSIQGALQVGSSGSSVDRVLRITLDRGQHHPVLRFALHHADGGEVSFSSVPLSDSPQAHADRLFQELRTLARAPLSQAADLERAVRRLGMNLWRELIPADLKELYLRERDRWQEGTFMVCSDEPWFPWELVWPWTSAGEDEFPWCISLKMTRWLRRHAQVGWQAGPPPRLHFGSAVVVAPVASGLVAAQAERKTLLGWMATRGVKDLSPPPRKSEVLALLEAGGYDWFHVAAHGTFQSQSPGLDAPLELEDGQSITPYDLVGSKLLAHISTRRPAFVLNACHLGRLGWGVASLEGWTGRLVEYGAGMVLASLWPVRDDGAGIFASHLYKALGEGRTLAEATRAARLAARRPGDPTWLAYTVYGHPNATLWDLKTSQGGKTRL